MCRIVLWCTYCVVVHVLCRGARIVSWCTYCVVVHVLCRGARKYKLYMG